MSNLIPIQTHPAGDATIMTEINCLPEGFESLLTQRGKVFRLESIAYNPATKSAMVVWEPQKPVTIVQYGGAKNGN